MYNDSSLCSSFDIAYRSHCISSSVFLKLYIIFPGLIRVDNWIISCLRRNAGCVTNDASIIYDIININRTMLFCRLKVSNVTLKDAGIYTCEGFNEFGRKLTRGRLIVRPGRLLPVLTTAVAGMVFKHIDFHRQLLLTIYHQLASQRSLLHHVHVHQTIVLHAAL